MRQPGEQGASLRAQEEGEAVRKEKLVEARACRNDEGVRRRGHCCYQGSVPQRAGAVYWSLAGADPRKRARKLVGDSKKRAGV